MEVQVLISTVKWKIEMLDGWIWDDGDIESYIVRSRYTTLKEFDQSLGSP